MTGNVDSEDGGAMIDPRNGNLLTTDDKIKDAAVYTYTKRLENRPIKDNLEHVKNANELLCESFSQQQKPIRLLHGR